VGTPTASHLQPTSAAINVTFANTVSPLQYWMAANNGAGSVTTLVNAKTGLCLDVSGGSKANGAAVVTNRCRAGAKNQQWKQVRARGGRWRFVNLRSGKALFAQIASRQATQRQAGSRSMTAEKASPVRTLR
jgi:hypothetical protein